MKRFLPLCALAPGLLLLAGTQAKAELSQSTVPQWTYSFNPASKALLTGQGGGVTFTGEQPITVNTSGTEVVLTHLQVFSGTGQGSEETLSPTKGAYSIGMTIASGSGSANLTFTGYLTGTLNSQGATIDNYFTGKTTQTADVGGYTFKVTLFNPRTGAPYYTAPSPPGSASDPTKQTLPGSIGAYVTVTPDSGGGNPGTSGNGTPEPSTLLLSCLGLSFLGAARWRKSCQVSVTLG